MSQLTNLWCLGAPQVAERLMTESEGDAVRSDVRANFVRASAWLLLGTLLPFGLGTAWMEAGLWRPLGAVLLFASLPGTVVGILKCLDSYRRARLLRREVLDPRIVVFEVSEAAEQKDIAAILDCTPPESGTLVFAVALATGRLRQVQDSTPSRDIVLAVQRITTDDVGMHRVVRLLTTEERAELLGLARGAWMYQMRSSAFFVLLGVVAVMRGRAMMTRGGLHALYAAAAAATGVVFLVGMVRTIIRVARVHADVRGRVALRVVLRSNEARTVCEVLPASRLVWTVEGSPARWRTGAVASLSAADRRS